MPFSPRLPQVVSEPIGSFKKILIIFFNKIYKIVKIRKNYKKHKKYKRKRKNRKNMKKIGVVQENRLENEINKIMKNQ